MKLSTTEDTEDTEARPMFMTLDLFPRVLRDLRGGELTAVARPYFFAKGKSSRFPHSSHAP